MSFYAIARDDDLSSDDPMLDLIDSGRTLDALREVTEFDPDQDSSRILRAKFDIVRREDHPVRDCSSGDMIPAHICVLSAA